MKRLILGGARSGKSARALALAEGAAPRRLFVATAEPFDDEMRARIALHRDERGPGWRTVDAPIELASALRSEPERGEAVLIDCLTLWLSNLLHYEKDLDRARADLLDALAETQADTTLVSNELGLGLAPDNALGRRFRDLQGRLNQHVAAACDHVEFVAAGLPMKLKG